MPALGQEPRLREMVPDDSRRCFHIRARTRENALSEEQLREWYGLTPDSLAASFGDTLRGWVHEHDGEVVGFAMGDATEGEVTVIALLPEHEGRGVGKALLDRVTGWLLEQDCAIPWLLTTADPALRAYGFYRAQGWRATGEVNEHGEERFEFDPSLEEPT